MKKYVFTMADGSEVVVRDTNDYYDAIRKGGVDDEKVVDFYSVDQDTE